jgi:hypothetical protein
MDCDQVFMILTRGPFPTGESTDEHVEDHLETCGDCWRLAEALRPAQEVFQEAVPPYEGRDLPGYWGDARPASVSASRITGTAARIATSKGQRTIVPTYDRQARVQPAANWLSELLPALAMASAMTAMVVGLVLWLRS